ncbi:hypothetical protein [Pandoraea norimbergensis]|uniref:Uncharacterized protein n=1 Tax=Pandoraea norimbergensis TaxID=93219 RepID=A0ABM5WKF5_9BURK|nr:hypothetical protein [Pandoraea norimbergensis]ALS60913.1 hypothetical protein AT302_15210 [Pandoraea norimbergensis]
MLQFETYFNHALAAPPKSIGRVSISPEREFPDLHLFDFLAMTGNTLASDISLPKTPAEISGASTRASLGDTTTHADSSLQCDTRLDERFSASNPAGETTNATAQLERHVGEHFDSSRRFRADIGAEALRQATARATHMPLRGHIVGKANVMRNQEFCIDPATGKGLPYLHERDKPFAAVLEDENRKVFTFLPGYATGDRYTLIIAALMEPRLNVVIGHAAQGDPKEVTRQAQDAETARKVMTEALEKNGIANAKERVSIFKFDDTGKALKNARESLDEPNTRDKFKAGPGAAGLTALIAKDEHIFHISVTTELIRRQFAQSEARANALPGEIRQRLWNLVEPGTRQRIDDAVDSLVRHHKLDKNSVGLWIADREGANERESQAISRPLMFEQIASRLKDEGLNVFDIADTYINPASDLPKGTFDRHPNRPEIRPQIGRFWNGKFDGEQLLAARENQWYFIDTLLSKTGSRLVGIRSGALEPFALLGHNVAYLEHKDMFTPERHASWQGHIPYRRVITEKTTGYLSSEVHVGNEPSRQAETELTLARLKRELLTHLLASQTEPRSDVRNGHKRAMHTIEKDVREIEASIEAGVLHEAELDLIVSRLGMGASEHHRLRPDQVACA